MAKTVLCGNQDRMHSTRETDSLDPATRLARSKYFVAIGPYDSRLISAVIYCNIGLATVVKFSSVKHSASN